VPQGGACGDAEEGIRMLADEIADAWFGDSAMGQQSAMAAGTSLDGHKTETTSFELAANEKADDLQPSPGSHSKVSIEPSSPSASASASSSSSPSPSSTTSPRAMAAVAAASAEGQSLVAKLRQDGGQSQRLAVVLPGGTGATALFLARHLQPRGIQVMELLAHKRKREREM